MLTGMLRHSNLALHTTAGCCHLMSNLMTSSQHCLTGDAGTQQPRPTSHCRVLSPGIKFNDIIPALLAICRRVLPPGEFNDIIPALLAICRRMLPPGEFNDIIPALLPICSQSFMSIAVTVAMATTFCDNKHCYKVTIATENRCLISCCRGELKNGLI